MRTKVCSVFALLIMLSMSLSVFAQVQEDSLVGWWRFDTMADETGNWGDIALHGATLVEGQLVVETGKWAHALDYTGPEITELTLASWLSLDNYARTNGSALTLDKVTVDQFCGIIWAERVDRQWMPGSSHFRRTDDFPRAVTETDSGDLHFIAITYKNVSNQYEITGYRNGESMGSFTKGDLRTWPAGDAEAVWGKRHTNGLTGPGDLNAHIEESRIYNVALTADEIETLQIEGLTLVEPQGKLATQWGALKFK
ncbi:LamG domain-containing protein [Candidatus Poribacteria bacterium]|nr:LamG domain-containing protein [Candidatus Poribacteria bacterium]MYB64091.1 LamG domain-containing protein [Candidatus Poribacteria bacterium]MYF54703.1 LamG domain-containing protein [Candidatus Poribacteria bacterium]MYI94926.1 LamG domain-containing protein [Candidatus Poribacteria bacterium]